MMKNKKQIETYIRSRQAHWMVELDLGTWEISLKFDRCEPNANGDPVYAKVGTTWEYKNMDITFDSPAMAREGVEKDFIDKTWAHELFHAKVARGWDMARLLANLVGEILVKLEEREVAELELMPLTRRAFVSEKE